MFDSNLSQNIKSQNSFYQIDSSQILSKNTSSEIQEIHELLIEWKIKRDYSQKLILCLTFSTKLTQKQSEQNDENNIIQKKTSDAANLLIELETFKSQFLGRKHIKLDFMNIVFHSENKCEQIIKNMNKFLNDLQDNLQFSDEFTMTICSNYNWLGLNIEIFAKNTKTLIIKDTYSYLALSNYQYPKLTNLIISPHIQEGQYPTIDASIGKVDYINDFQTLVCQQLLKQLENIEINTYQYPCFIQILIPYLLNEPKICLKKLDLQLCLEPHQFHLIFSLSHINNILNNLKLSLNYVIDFGYLDKNHKSCPLINKLFSQNAEQTINFFPYLFQQIQQQSFTNKNVNITFKNLKSKEQLDLFDQIRSNQNYFLSNLNAPTSELIKCFQKQQNFSSSLTSSIYQKYKQIQPQTINFNQESYNQQHNENNIIQNTIEKYCNQMPIKQGYCCNSQINSNFYKMSPHYQEILQKKQFNQNNQQQSKLQGKEQSSINKQENNSNSNNESNSKNNIILNNFLAFKNEGVISIELVFENTVFGNNYKEIFEFISKCIHLKKLKLINFCLEDDLNNNDQQNQINNQQNYKPQTLQAMRLYSAVFKQQSQKGISNIIPELISSLKKASLITFKLSTNISFTEQQLGKFLQTQSDMVHFNIKDFSNNKYNSEISFAPQQSLQQKKPKWVQLTDFIIQLIQLNQNLLSYRYSDYCSRIEFQKIIRKYFQAKKILIYQIYCSRFLLESGTIKRKEIFIHLINQFLIKNNNTPLNLIYLLQEYSFKDI